LQDRRNRQSAGEDAVQSPGGKIGALRNCFSSGAIDFSVDYPVARQNRTAHRPLALIFLEGSPYSPAKFYWPAGKGFHLRTSQVLSWKYGFSAAGAEKSLEIVAFIDFLPTRRELSIMSLQFRTFRRSSRSSAENPHQSQKSRAVSRTFRTSAEQRNLQRKRQKFS
jgi:hypothetical protein